MDVNALNMSAWESADRTKEYTAAEYIFPAERVLIDRVAPRIRHAPILELGCGGGRLTPLLLDLSAQYVGVDYVQGMVDACREKYPGVVFQRMDARDLSALSGGTFGAVVFAFNGLDCVDRSGRQQILAGVHRLLRPGGVFLFSSHNYDWALRHPFAARPEYRCHEFHGNGWALLNNPVYESAFLTHYTTIAQQRDDLATAGFSGTTVVFSPDGNPIAEPEEASTQPWLYYCVTR